jgi:hypothetical protein
MSVASGMLISMEKNRKYKGIENPKYAREIAELRRSNASGTHLDKRTKRARTRQSQLIKAMKEEI